MTYVNNAMTFTGSQLKAILDVYEPSGVAVKTYHSSAVRNLVVTGSTLWTKVARNIGQDIGTYYYNGAALTGYRPAKVSLDDHTAYQFDDLQSVLPGHYVWGDYNSLGKKTMYVQMPVDNVNDVEWRQSTVTTEWYYGETDILVEPSRVVVGNTELTKGTIGALSQGQYGWGNADGLSGNRLYVRLPTAELIDGATNPNAAQYGDNFIRISHSPDKFAAGYVNAREWIELTRGATKPVDNGFVEVQYSSATNLGLDVVQILIEGTTSSDIRRPYARNLRSYMV